MAVGRFLVVDGRMDQNVVLYVYVGGMGLMRVLKLPKTESRRQQVRYSCVRVSALSPQLKEGLCPGRPFSTRTLAS